MLLHSWLVRLLSPVFCLLSSGLLFVVYCLFFAVICLLSSAKVILPGVCRKDWSDSWTLTGRC